MRRILLLSASFLLMLAGGDDRFYNNIFTVAPRFRPVHEI